MMGLDKLQMDGSMVRKPDQVWRRQINGAQHMYAMWTVAAGGKLSGSLHYLGISDFTEEVIDAARRLAPGRLIAQIGPYVLGRIHEIAQECVNENAKALATRGGVNDGLGMETADLA